MSWSAAKFAKWVIGTTYDLIKDAFECKRRGMADVKGIGEIEAWFAAGAKRKAGYRNESAFIQKRTLY